VCVCVCVCVCVVCECVCVCVCAVRLDPVVICSFSYTFNMFAVILEEQDSKIWMYIRVSLILNVP